MINAINKKSQQHALAMTRVGVIEYLLLNPSEAGIWGNIGRFRDFLELGSMGKTQGHRLGEITFPKHKEAKCSYISIRQRSNNRYIYIRQGSCK